MDKLGTTAQLGMLLARLKRKMHKRMSDLLKPYELTPEQRAILLTLEKQGAMTQAQLCELTATEPSNLSTTLKRLIKKEYITKIDHPNDPRAYHIKLTQKAESIIDELGALSLFLDKELMQRIDDKDFRITFMTLEKLEKNL